MNKPNLVLFLTLFVFPAPSYAVGQSEYFSCMADRFSQEADLQSMRIKSLENARARTVLRGYTLGIMIEYHFLSSFGISNAHLQVAEMNAFTPELSTLLTNTEEYGKLSLEDFISQRQDFVTDLGYRYPRGEDSPIISPHDPVIKRAASPLVRELELRMNNLEIETRRLKGLYPALEEAEKLKGQEIDAIDCGTID